MKIPFWSTVYTLVSKALYGKYYTGIQVLCKGLLNNDAFSMYSFRLITFGILLSVRIRKVMCEENIVTPQKEFAVMKLKIANFEHFILKQKKSLKSVFSHSLKEWLY